MKTLFRVLALFALAAAFLAAPVGRALEPIPRPEHPRPDLMREAWQNLNGGWSLDDGRNIVVPFPAESQLSGIGEPAPKDFTYRVKFSLDDALASYKDGGSRVILHFGAVDYIASVSLNGKELGSHRGGYTPFSFDVTDALKEGDNELAVKVFDSLDPMQVRGKQSTTGKGYSIFYTPVSGIWQTVWLEKVGKVYVKNFRFTPATDLSGGTFEVFLSREAADAWGYVFITGPDGEKERVEWKSGGQALWKTAQPRPWSPEDPFLYDVEVVVAGEGGEVIDSVKSYIGIRTVEARDGKVWLNGKEFYQKLLLDQGYFPGGIYTPATDEIMRADVEMYKRMGFNGLRKHQKIEDPRFLYWCDKLGLVVWEEMPSIGTVAASAPPKAAREQFIVEWKEAIARDYNHPSIITWVPFNENWGIREAKRNPEIKAWARETISATHASDPTRLVVDNSGGFHLETDVWDFHHYLSTAEKSRWLYEQYDMKPGDHRGRAWHLYAALTGRGVIASFFPGVDYQGQPVIVSEYGGFGYYFTEGDQSLLEKYRDFTLAINEFPYIDGYCYTQPYDVEQEQNGLMTFDRVPKVEPEKIKEINDQMGPKD